MRNMTLLERRYRRAHLSCVRHITLDPKGPGVVRLHMLPPRGEDGDAPFLLLLNGAQLLPLNVSWAVLLSCFMDALYPFAGREIGEEDWDGIRRRTVRQARRVYPGTKRARLAEDLSLLLESLVAIARGEEPPVEVAPLSLGAYAPYMTAPHRMDLMVSAMEKNGVWHCNQKCLHCYAAGQQLGQTAELDTAAWTALLEKLRRAGVPQVTFTGGEPTLREDLVALVSAAQWFVTRLNTNGQLLTPSLCRSLFAASLDSVQITLYAADSAVHNALVGADGFDKTVQGIRNAVEAGLNVSVNTPLCSQNADYAATLRFARSLGVRYATCSGLIPSGAAEGAASRATALTAQKLTDVLRRAMDAARELEIEVDFTSPGWLSEDTLRELGFTLIPSCGACLSNMALSPDGTVVPCQSWLGGTTLGNLCTEDWDAIWTGDTCRAIRAQSAKMEQKCQLHGGNKGGGAQ